MTHRPHYELTVECPKCQTAIDVTFLEIGRYEFAPVVGACPECGFANRAELERLAWDANDVAAERQGLERVQDV